MKHNHEQSPGELFERQKEIRDSLTPNRPSEWWNNMVDKLGKADKEKPDSAKTLWDDSHKQKPDGNQDSPTFTPLKLPKEKWDYSGVPSGDEAIRIAGGNRLKPWQARLQKFGRAVRSLCAGRERPENGYAASTPSVVQIEDAPLDAPELEVAPEVQPEILDATRIPEVQAYDYSESRQPVEPAEEPVILDQEVSPTPAVVETKEMRKKPRSWRRRLGAAALIVATSVGAFTGGGSRDPGNATLAPTVASSRVDAHDNFSTPFEAPTSTITSQPAAQPEAPMAPETAPSVEIPAVVEAQPSTQPELFDGRTMTSEGIQTLHEYYQDYSVKDGDTKWRLAQNFLEKTGQEITRAKIAEVVRVWESTHMTPQHPNGWLVTGERVTSVK